MHSSSSKLCNQKMKIPFPTNDRHCWHRRASRSPQTQKTRRKCPPWLWTFLMTNMCRICSDEGRGGWKVQLYRTVVYRTVRTVWESSTEYPRSCCVLLVRRTDPGARQGRSTTTHELFVSRTRSISFIFLPSAYDRQKSCFRDEKSIVNPLLPFFDCNESPSKAEQNPPKFLLLHRILLFHHKSPYSTLILLLSSGNIIQNICSNRKKLAQSH